MRPSVTIGHQNTNKFQVGAHNLRRGAGSRDRLILHVDMNAFYAACHAAAEPARYAARPVAVAGDPSRRHGIVLTASYEARSRGVRTAMPVGQALSLCPELVLIAPDFTLYRTVSRQMLDLFRRFTPLVEPFSIDEAWLDLTGCPAQASGPREAARTLQRQVAAELSLPCSVGIADNKLLAKIASGWRKPGGITTLWSAQVPELLWPRPVEALFGVGPGTARRLRALGIGTVGQLAAAPTALLRQRCGVLGLVLQARANGLDDSPVVAEDTERKSVSHSVTLPADLRDPRAVRPVLLALADQVGRRLRHLGLMAGQVTLQLKDASFRSTSRSAPLSEPSDLTGVLFAAAWHLFTARPTPALRLVGLAAGNLSPVDAPRQLRLFPEPESNMTARRLAEAEDRIRDRFGEQALVRAALLDGSPRALLDRRAWGSSFQKSAP